MGKIAKSSELTLKHLNPKIYSELLPKEQQDVDFDLELIPATACYKLKFQCSTCSHQWSARLRDRTLLQIGCKMCFRKKRKEEMVKCKDETRLFKNTHPQVYAEINWSKVPTGVDPSTLSYGSDIKIPFTCGTCSYEWDSMVKNRCSKLSNSNCKKCFQAKPRLKKVEKLALANLSK